MLDKTSLFSLFLFVTSASYAADKIGISQIISNPALDQNLKGIQETLAKNGIKKENIEFQNAQGNPTLAAGIARHFIQDKTVIIAIGTGSAQAFLPFQQQKKFSLVFTAITNPREAGLVKNLTKPEANFTGISDHVSAQKQLLFMKKVLGKTKLRVGVLYNPSDSNSLSALQDTEAAGIQEGVTILKVSATKLADMLAATQKLVKDVDVLFINNDNLALSAVSKLVKIGEKAQKAVFSSDIDTIQLGVLGALGPDQYDLGRQTAEIALSLLKGKAISSIPVLYPEVVVQSLNIGQAKKLGLALSEDVLKTSVLVDS